MIAYLQPVRLNRTMSPTSARRSCTQQNILTALPRRFQHDREKLLLDEPLRTLRYEAGGFEMYCEPQDAFFPVDEHAASLIILHEFAEPLVARAVQLRRSPL